MYSVKDAFVHMYSVEVEMIWVNESNERETYIAYVNKNRGVYGAHIA